MSYSISTLADAAVRAFERDGRVVARAATLAVGRGKAETHSQCNAAPMYPCCIVAVDMRSRGNWSVRDRAGCLPCAYPAEGSLGAVTISH